MLKKEELQALVDWAKKTQKIFNEAGEGDFKELRKREKASIIYALKESGLKIETDGDSDGMFMRVDIKDESIDISVELFSSSYYLEDFEDNLRTLQCWFNDLVYNPSYDGSDMTFDEFVDMIDGLLQEDITIVNLTPHTVTIYAADAETVIKTIPSAGVARAEQYREYIGEINGIPVSKTEYGKVEGLPEKARNTIYIVSVLTAQAAKDRTDLYIVDDIVRDASGQIIGCKALAQITQ